MAAFPLDVRPTQAVLVIADISGFTSFMRLHALADSHAKQIVVRLLTVLVEHHRSPLRVAELEGDAVFLWGPLEPREPGAGADLTQQVLGFFGAFRREIAALRALPLCVCGACLNVADLRLKQVVHIGEVATERIGGFEKLFGIDVIVVHRMLKNSVGSHEYVLMTDTAHAALGPPGPVEGVPVVEQLDGIGEVPMLLFDASQLEPFPDPPDSARPGRMRTLRWKLGMHGRTLRDLLRPKR
jgi:class 3 adenylate cyclase